MKLELRLCLTCNLCEMEVEAVPECLRPRDALTGQINLPFCYQLGICPVCFTEIIDLTPTKWAKMMRRYKRRKR